MSDGLRDNGSSTAGGRLRPGPPALALVGIVLLCLLWHQVFTMTGLLWWDAPDRQQPVARPAVVEIAPPDKDWVDVEAYLNTHPIWRY